MECQVGGARALRESLATGYHRASQGITGYHRVSQCVVPASEILKIPCMAAELSCRAFGREFFLFTVFEEDLAMQR